MKLNQNTFLGLFILLPNEKSSFAISVLINKNVIIAIVINSSNIIGVQLGIISSTCALNPKFRLYSPNTKVNEKRIENIKYKTL